MIHELKLKTFKYVFILMFLPPRKVPTLDSVIMDRSKENKYAIDKV